MRYSTDMLEYAFFFVLSALALAAEPSTKVDGLLAKVGREPVMASDLDRFVDLDDILICAGKRSSERVLPTAQAQLLSVYVEEELMYQEAKAKKLSTDGATQDAVKTIHSRPACKTKWQNLGEKYITLWKTGAHPREGQSLLVRELEKRVLVDKFRKSEFIGDMDVWRREARTRYPVKIYLE